MNIEATAKQIMAARHSDAFDQEACEKILAALVEPLNEQIEGWKRYGLRVEGSCKVGSAMEKIILHQLGLAEKENYHLRRKLETEQISLDAQLSHKDDQRALKAELLRRGLDADKTSLEIEAKINRHLEEQALPCPFCSSDEIQLCSIADGSWTIDCHTCGAGSGTNDKEFVLAAWNKRAAQPKPELEGVRRYRKRPVVIEALRFDRNVAEVCAFIGGTEGNHYVTRPPDAIGIRTLEGTIWASRGDYVIKGVKGEFYPCKPDIFQATYETV